MAVEDSNIVNVFIPCQMDMFQPYTAFSVMTLLERLGVRCQYMEEQTCCGRRFFMEGDTKSAKDLAYQLVEQLGVNQPIVIPDSSCAGYMRTYYRSLLDASVQPQQLKQFKQRVFELCDYIVNVRHIEDLDNTLCGSVYYFKSCAARNLYPANNAPETLLKNTKGLELLLDEEYHGCCGANGRFPLANPQAAEAMAAEIVNRAYEMGAKFITSTDIHCLQMLDAYIQRNEKDIDVMHIADILKGE